VRAKPPESIAAEMSLVLRVATLASIRPGYLSGPTWESVTRPSASSRCSAARGKGQPQLLAAAGVQLRRINAAQAHAGFDIAARRRPHARNEGVAVDDAHHFGYIDARVRLAAAIAIRPVSRRSLRVRQQVRIDELNGHHAQAQQYTGNEPSVAASRIGQSRKRRMKHCRPLPTRDDKVLGYYSSPRAGQAEFIQTGGVGLKIGDQPVLFPIAKAGGIEAAAATGFLALFRGLAVAFGAAGCRFGQRALGGRGQRAFLCGLGWHRP
jgi:hypothetical protein